MNAIPTLNLQYKKNEIYKEIYNAVISEQVRIILFLIKIQFHLISLRLVFQL